MPCDLSPYPLHPSHNMRKGDDGRQPFVRGPDYSLSAAVVRMTNPQKSPSAATLKVPHLKPVREQERHERRVVVRSLPTSVSRVVDSTGLVDSPSYLQQHKAPWDAIDEEVQTNKSHCRVGQFPSSKAARQNCSRPKASNSDIIIFTICRFLVLYVLFVSNN